MVIDDTGFRRRRQTVGRGVEILFRTGPILPTALRRSRERMPGDRRRERQLAMMNENERAARSDPSFAAFAREIRL